jgi:hypothetical protein
MPAFQSKTIKFAHSGMNWNRPVDLIPEGQVCYAKNIRIGQQGITARWRNYLADLRRQHPPITRLNNYLASCSTYIVEGIPSLRAGRPSAYKSA